MKIDFMLAFRNRALTTPKYGNLSSFPASSFDFLELMNHQGLGILILDFSPYFPDLVQTFYCNLYTSTICIVKSYEKRTNSVLSMEDFRRCLDVYFEGERIFQGSTCDWVDYEKNRHYYSISRLNEQEIYVKRARNARAAPNSHILYSTNLSVSDRMLHYFIAYILIPKPLQPFTNQ